MRGTFMLSLVALVTAGATVGYTATGNAQSPSNRDEEAIKKIIGEMTDGFYKHDAKAAARMYTGDADFVTVRGESAKGAGEIEKRMAAIFGTRAKEATLRTLDVKIRFIRRDVALAHVTNELSGLIGPDGQHFPAHQELSVRVFVKDDGVWRVAAFHNTMVRAFEASAFAEVIIEVSERRTGRSGRRMRSISRSSGSRPPRSQIVTKSAAGSPICDNLLRA